ncbi:MAG: shikimate dehydrogenase [Candidatus Nitrosocaldaceae archaeon]|nr:MAG: shikimate dehydrogenase [Candidatus Nitrosocaldaceae archaeon]
MKTYCVIGDPIDHSLSPAMHNAAFRILNLDCIYIAMRVRVGELDAAIKSIKATRIAGFNVTMPHKVAIMQYLDKLDKSSILANAVNTVDIKDDTMIGYNTDIHGFIKPIKDRNISLKDKDVLLLGAGGAARAIIVALADEKINRLIIANRSIDKARRLIDDLKSSIDVKFDIKFIGLEEAKDYSYDSYLIVNATPLGMKYEPSIIPSENINPDSIVYDIVYRPMNTPLIEEAMSANAKIIYGYEMLLEQGAKAFEIWLGIEAPRDVMKMALLGGFG